MQITVKQGSTFNNAYWRIFSNIQNKYSNNGCFLEIGAADPERTSVLASRYRNLIGLDIDFARLSKVQSAKLCNADACKLPFNNEAFDGVIAHHVIEHIIDDRCFIEEIHRVLKRGGFVILGTPNKDRLASIIYDGLISKRKFPWREHIREYDKDTLNQLLDKKLFSRINITGNFIGLHSSSLVIGFDRCPGILERWCNFWFIELLK